MVLRHVVGSGAIESRSYGCVTLHAVGPGARSRTIMALARGAAPARRDPPETRRPYTTKEENGRAPRIAAAILPAAIPVLLHRGYTCHPDLDTCRNQSGFDVAPERDEQLLCHGHNGDPP